MCGDRGSSSGSCGSSSGTSGGGIYSVSDGGICGCSGIGNGGGSGDSCSYRGSDIGGSGSS